MTRVPATNVRRGVYPQRCPIGQTVCARFVGQKDCKHFVGVISSDSGKTTVLCSAPTGKGKTK